MGEISSKQPMNNWKVFRKYNDYQAGKDFPDNSVSHQQAFFEFDKYVEDIHYDYETANTLLNLNKVDYEKLEEEKYLEQISKYENYYDDDLSCDGMTCPFCGSEDSYNSNYICDCGNSILD